MGGHAAEVCKVWGAEPLENQVKNKLICLF